jgi:hypothetical protein
MQIRRHGLVDFHIYCRKKTKKTKFHETCQILKGSFTAVYECLEIYLQVVLSAHVLENQVFSICQSKFEY